MVFKKIFGKGKKKVISLAIISSLLANPVMAQSLANHNLNTGFTSENIVQTSDRLTDLKNEGENIIDSMTISYESMIELIKGFENSTDINDYSQFKENFERSLVNFDESCERLDNNLDRVISLINFLDGLNNLSKNDLNISADELRTLLTLKPELLKLKAKLFDYRQVCKNVNDNIVSLGIIMSNGDRITSEHKERIMRFYRLITEGNAREFWDLVNYLYKD